VISPKRLSLPQAEILPRRREAMNGSRRSSARCVPILSRSACRSRTAQILRLERQKPFKGEPSQRVPRRVWRRMTARSARNWLEPIPQTNRAKGVKNNMSSPFAPNRIVRPIQKLLPISLVYMRVLAQHRITHERQRRKSRTNKSSTVVTARISKMRDR
jgi:hypothetical protein